jgi:hypothetical protein
MNFFKRDGLARPSRETVSFNEPQPELPADCREVGIDPQSGSGIGAKKQLSADKEDTNRSVLMGF